MSTELASSPASGSSADPDGETHRSRRWTWFAGRAGTVLGVCLVVLFVTAFVGQRGLLYQAPRTDVLAVPQGGRTLGAVASDGITTPVWFFPASTPACARDGRSPTIVFFHGIASDRSNTVGVAQTYVRRGYNVALPEYRGFADAEGTPTEDGLVADASAALGVVRAQPEVDAAHIIIGGFSLGTGVALRLATDEPVAAVTLWAPYTSLPDVAWHLHPVLPYHLLMWDQFNSEERVSQLHVPLLVAEGTDDTMIPNSQSEAVYGNAPVPGGLVRFDGADHVPTYFAALNSPTIVEFVDRHGDCHAPASTP